LTFAQALDFLNWNKKLYWGSPLLALGVPNPFSNYIFCEEDPPSFQALRQRVIRLFPEASVDFVEGNCDQQIHQIADCIPKGQVLSFCFADPFDLSIRFASIKHLASWRMDFLFLLALHMDANRNEAHYTNRNNRKIDEFLGMADWRDRWNEAESKGTKFPRFLAELFSEQMTGLGYLPVPFHRMKQVRSDGNHPLYHLALFSKHELAFRFWGDVLKYGSDQRSFKYPE
jgi:three-Cys-motif partner protein